jgi:hypothetical protein
VGSEELSESVSSGEFGVGSEELSENVSRRIQYSFGHSDYLLGRVVRGENSVV